MGLFRKKPVVIEARQLPEDSRSNVWRGIASWSGGTSSQDALSPCVLIDTDEGQMMARPGDWVIKGINGEFYPCKPDIFAATYEVAE
jgi:hypothetical protein